MVCVAKVSLLWNLLLLFWVFPAASVLWRPQDFPDPQRNLQDCGRNGKQSYVCDPDRILSYKEGDDIDDAIEKLRKSTGPCICKEKCPLGRDYSGYQPAVALVNQMYIKYKGSSPTSKEKKKAADDFSDDLRDSYWDYGRCNDDFVIFVAKYDRQIYTAVGDKTRIILTDACVDQVYKNNRALFSNGDWAKGIKNMLNEYMSVLQRNHTCNKPVDPKTALIIAGVAAGTGVGGCCLFVYLRKKHGICKDCNSKSDGGSSEKYSSPKHHSSGKWSGGGDSDKDSVSSGGGGGDF